MRWDGEDSEVGERVYGTCTHSHCKVLQWDLQIQIQLLCPL